jgi:ABC-type amino acid transport substrate-binding protein
MLRYFIPIVSLVFLCVSVASAAGQFNIRKLEDEKQDLAKNILLLALQKVDPAARLVESDTLMTEARLVEAVKAQKIDILWAGAAPDKERELLTVRIPILKGLLGHRIFIVKADAKHRFANVRSLADLQGFNAGQGTFWGDTQVLKNANIPTVTTIKYQNLFPMLEGERFDYFPRAVHEPWLEVQQYQHLNLTVDPHVMLVYPYAMYFYVNKNNRALHDMIYRGLEMAILDGSYDKIFYNDPTVKQALQYANLSKRQIIRIDNPDMHPDTPLTRKEFWLDINQL